METLQTIGSFFSSVWDMLMSYKMPVIGISYGAYIIAGILLSLSFSVLRFLGVIGSGSQTGAGIRGGNSRGKKKGASNEGDNA